MFKCLFYNHFYINFANVNIKQQQNNPLKQQKIMAAKNLNPVELAKQLINAKSDKEADKIYKQLEKVCACKEEIDCVIWEALESR